MHLTMLWQRFSLFKNLMVNFIQLLSFPKLSPRLSLIMMFMTRSFLQFMKLSRHGIIILKVLLFLLMLLLTIKIWSIFQLQKCSPSDKLIGPSTFVLLTWLSGFSLVNLEPNPMCLLVVWTSTLKREENIMVMLTHIIVDLFSCLNNYWPHSKLLPYFLQSFMDLFHWMWKILTKIFFLL